MSKLYHTLSSILHIKFNACYPKKKISHILLIMPFFTLTYGPVLFEGQIFFCISMNVSLIRKSVSLEFTFQNQYQTNAWNCSNHKRFKFVLRKLSNITT